MRKIIDKIIDLFECAAWAILVWMAVAIFAISAYALTHAGQGVPTWAMVLLHY